MTVEDTDMRSIGGHGCAQKARISLNNSLTCLVDTYGENFDQIVEIQFSL